MAIDLRRRGFATALLGVDADPVNASAAEKMGLVDKVVSLEECIDGSDLVIVSVPVGAALKLIPSILDRYENTGAKDKIVIDVCSTKEQLAKTLENYGELKQQSENLRKHHKGLLNRINQLENHRAALR